MQITFNLFVFFKNFATKIIFGFHFESCLLSLCKHKTCNTNSQLKKLPNENMDVSIEAD